MTLLNRQTLLVAPAAATTGSWYPLDYRIDSGGTVRTFTGTLTAGDTVYFEVTNENPFNSDGSVNANVSVIATVSAYTTTPFSGAFQGQFSAIRFRKTGTAGVAIVNGVV